MRNIRPDPAEHVRPVGYLLDRIGEAVEIVSRPFPGDCRQKGFVQARKSEAAKHIGIPAVALAGGLTNARQNRPALSRGYNVMTW